MQCILLCSISVAFTFFFNLLTTTWSSGDPCGAMKISYLLIYGYRFLFAYEAQLGKAFKRKTVVPKFKMQHFRQFSDLTCSM